MHCNDSQALIPSYLDEELSEVQAAPLRQHLLDCPTCRSAAQEARALRAWFVPTPEIAVPEGFAARVARRAMAGDRGTDAGLPEHELQPVRAAGRGEGSLLPFLLRATAVAAAALFVLSLGIQYQNRPDMEELQALEGVDLTHELDVLDRLNRAEAEAARRRTGVQPPASADERDARPTPPARDGVEDER